MLEVFIAPVVGYAALIVLAVLWAELTAERLWRRAARANASAPTSTSTPIEREVEPLRRAA